ncbi:hypothetical protein J0H58_15080 [bacterium]|nr:hypothetical protein [bacterium]
MRPPIVASPPALRLLLLVATGATSLFDVVRRRFPFPHHPADRAVHVNTGAVGAVTAGLNRGLHAVLHLSRLDRRRGVLALDTHLVPDYGRRSRPWSVDRGRTAPRTFTGTRRPSWWRPDGGTRPPWNRIPPGDRPHDLVRRLLDRVAAGGLKVRGVTADSGFDSGDTLLLLP